MRRYYSVANYVHGVMKGNVNSLTALECLANYKLAMALIYKPEAMALTSRFLASCLQPISLYKSDIGDKNSKCAIQVKTKRCGTSYAEEMYQKILAKNMYSDVYNKQLSDNFIFCPMYHSISEIPSSANQKIANNINENNENFNKFSSNEKILELNDMNFKSVISKHKLLLVLFYAPWCKYCTDMKPRFFRAAKELPKDVGSLAICDAESSQKLALKYEVYVFPTLKLFYYGKYLTDYTGSRRSLELIKFMTEQSKKVNEVEQ